MWIKPSESCCTETLSVASLQAVEWRDISCGRFTPQSANSIPGALVCLLAHKDKLIASRCSG